MILPPLQSKDDLILYAHKDPRYIIESGFKVINKEKEEVPFVFNSVQNTFYDDRTARDDVLKFSQGGFSTMILSILTIKFLLIRNSWSVCISHEDEATRRLFSKVDYWLNKRNLPPWLQPFLKLKEDSSHSLFNEVTNSRFYIGTAGAATPFGRGDTIHYAHMSEISRWKDNGTVATNILRAMPMDEENTWAVKETTANGEGNYHHKEWQRERRGEVAQGFEDVKMKFKPHFFAWFEYPDYREPEAKIDPETYDDTEVYLAKRFKLKADRLQWRRNMVAQLPFEAGHTPEEMFMQEFPSDEQEAFLASGNPIFAPKDVLYYKTEAKKPIIVGNLVGIAPNCTVDETPKGYYQFWDMPDIDGKYIIFGDVGQFSDRCVGVVVDKKTWKIVAKFKAVIRAHVFGDELNKLGHFFNDAEIAVEINNMGQSTADRLVDLKYPNLYMRTRFDKKKKVETEEVGWYTSEKTKALIVGYMQELLRKQEPGMIPDIEILDEFSTFIKKPSGTMGASTGNFDDQVIATCGAFYVLKLHPFVNTVKAKVRPVSVSVRKFKKLRTGGGYRRSNS